MSVWVFRLVSPLLLLGSCSPVLFGIQEKHVSPGFLPFLSCFIEGLPSPGSLVYSLAVTSAILQEHRLQLGLNKNK